MNHIFDSYSSQRWRVDIVNQMLRDYSCQPISDSWVIVVFTFILDLAAVIATAIIKYKDEGLWRFQKNISDKCSNITYNATYIE